MGKPLKQIGSKVKSVRNNKKDKSKKLLLIIGGGIEQIKAYELAREMGYTVVGSDQNLKAPALKLADYRIRASTRNVVETLGAVKVFERETHKISGVMTLANDVPLTVATVAKELNLSGIPIQSAKIASDKILMKNCLKKSGVSLPPYKEIFSVADLKRMVKSWGYPLVIKPSDSRGSRGVLRITSKIDPEWAFDYALANSSNKRVLVEKFIKGIQLSAESFIYKGTCYTAACSQRNYEYLLRLSPFIIENGGVLPANLSKNALTKIDEILQKCASSLGIKNGTIKGDLILTKKGPVVIEIATRLSGGFLCTDQIPKATGVDLVRQTIKLAMGEKIELSDLKPQNLCSIGVRYLFPDPGKVTNIKGFKELGTYSWILKKLLYIRKGSIIRPYTDHTRRAGLVMAIGQNRKQAQDRVRKAVESINISTAPLV